MSLNLKLTRKTRWKSILTRISLEHRAQQAKSHQKWGWLKKGVEILLSRAYRKHPNSRVQNEKLGNRPWRMRKMERQFRGERLDLEWQRKNQLKLITISKISMQSKFRGSTTYWNIKSVSKSQPNTKSRLWRRCSRPTLVQCGFNQIKAIVVPKRKKRFLVVSK